MNTKRIVFVNDQGATSVIAPGDSDLTIEEIAEKDVPPLRVWHGTGEFEQDEETGEMEEVGHWEDALSVWLCVLPLFLFSAPSLAALSFLTGPSLPGVLRWFSTLNATLDGGIEQGVDGFDPSAKGFKLWWQRTRWTYRNPCNGWQSELLGVSDISKAFIVKREVPLLFGFHIKWWTGWNPNKRGGNYYPYAFQCGLKRH